ncbi:hypothetical protein BHM03_00056076 [Ensete ventricosum]|nr:hypothetical protein BHM03_00056076 [Ensete ventricosum]
MKVVASVQQFDLGTVATVPCGSAPSSPKHSDDPFVLDCHCTSAPASPTHAAAVYARFCGDGCLPPSPCSHASRVPFVWEEKPGTPKSHFSSSGEDVNGDKLRFAFGLRGEKTGTRVDDGQLFEEGRAPPLKPPPRLQYPTLEDGVSVTSSPRSPRSPGLRGLWSAGHQGKGGAEEELDPFTIAMMEATRDRSGSEKATASSFADRAKGGASSKWRLRELLLFRSASRELLGRYTFLSSSSSSSSSSSNANFGSTHCHNSSHEDGAASGELKKTNALRHRQGLLGRIRFRGH